MATVLRTLLTVIRVFFFARRFNILYTLAAIDPFDIADQVSYISTGGGAFLAYVEGKELPAVRALKAR